MSKVHVQGMLNLLKGATTDEVEAAVEKYVKANPGQVSGHVDLKVNGHTVSGTLVKSTVTGLVEYAVSGFVRAAVRAAAKAVAGRKRATTERTVKRGKRGL